MPTVASVYVLTCSLACLVGGFAPSIDIPETTTEPPPTTPDPATVPYFLHHLNATNVTISRGKTATLDCQVFRLRDRMVSWVRRQGDTIHLLTFGSTTYHSNDRYQLEFVEPNNWQLVIHAAEEGDQGAYECQVSSHPPKIRKVYLSVYVPRLEIFDGRGEAIHEKFYQVGSSIDLRCDAYHVPQDSVVWSRGDAKVYHAPDVGVRREFCSYAALNQHGQRWPLPPRTNANGCNSPSWTLISLRSRVLGAGSAKGVGRLSVLGVRRG
ncbi:cell adhesion molecule 1-like isoform X2 [Panulirus ornatus]|uniref:cell adhesion molecule 1-like isoform X2 n=1 Tax=Panulirus ornatus TaxID=150431 RepID=UPI003A8800DF